MKLELDINMTQNNGSINGVPCDFYGTDPMRSISVAIEDYLLGLKDKLDGLFHKEVFWPQELQLAIEWKLHKPYSIKPTAHLHKRLKENNLPATCYKAMLYGEVIEAEVSNGNIVKIITRLHNHRRPQQDICAAIMFKRDLRNIDYAVVKTMWTNKSHDNHATLRRENYVQPEYTYLQ